MTETHDPNRPARRGGLNFWQWLGILIIAGGVIFYLWRNLTEEEETPRQINDPAPTQAEGPGETGVSD